VLPHAQLVIEKEITIFVLNALLVAILAIKMENVCLAPEVTSSLRTKENVLFTVLLVTTQIVT
jgi:hypothetical protein